MVQRPNRGLDLLHAAPPDPAPPRAPRERASTAKKRPPKRYPLPKGARPHPPRPRGCAPPCRKPARAHGSRCARHARHPPPTRPRLRAPVPTHRPPSDAVAAAAPRIRAPTGPTQGVRPHRPLIRLPHTPSLPPSLPPPLPHTSTTPSVLRRAHSRLSSTHTHTHTHPRHALETPRQQLSQLSPVQRRPTALSESGCFPSTRFFFFFFERWFLGQLDTRHNAGLPLFWRVRGVNASTSRVEGHIIDWKTDRGWSRTWAGLRVYAMEAGVLLRCATLMPGVNSHVRDKLRVRGTGTECAVLAIAPRRTGAA